jgi:hypothetical protein
MITLVSEEECYWVSGNVTSTITPESKCVLKVFTIYLFILTYFIILLFHFILYFIFILFFILFFIFIYLFIIIIILIIFYLLIFIYDDDQESVSCEDLVYSFQCETPLLDGISCVWVEAESVSCKEKMEECEDIENSKEWCETGGAISSGTSCIWVDKNDETGKGDECVTEV